MSAVFLAILPIFGLIFVGFLLRRSDFPGPGFWPVSERLTYFVLFPSMLVQGLAGKAIQPDGLPLAGAVLGAVVVTAALTRAAKPLLKLDGPAYSSLFQGAIRPNTYVGMSLAAGLLGPDWLSLSAVALLTMIPAVNVLCVLTLSRHGSGNSGGVSGVLRELVRNPLLMACLIGLLMNVFDVVLPRALNDLMDILGRAALPMGLLAVGAGLRLERTEGGKRALAASSVLHLFVLPLSAFGLCFVFGADETACLTAVIYTAIPVSVSSFILARQLGGDHRLMSQIITVQTLVSAGTLPLIIGLLG